MSQKGDLPASAVYSASAGCGVPIFTAAHTLEFLALQAGHATHITAGKVVSIVVSAGSLLLNWSLMRKGVLITGNGSASFGADMRRLPRLLTAFFLAPGVALCRAVRGESVEHQNNSPDQRLICKGDES